MRLIFALVAVIALTAIALPAVCAEKSTADSTFNKPVTLAVKGEALSDVVSVLQKQTGVKLRVESVLADRKVTVFVDHKPLKAVMDALDTLLGAHWKKSSGDDPGYVLTEDLETRKARQEWNKSSVEKAWVELDAQIRRRAKLLGSTSASAKDKPEQPEISQEDLLYTNDPFFTPVIKFYQGLPEGISQYITPGTTIRLDSDTDELVWKLPKSVIDDLMAARAAWIEEGDRLSALFPNPDRPATVQADDEKPADVNLSITLKQTEYGIELRSNVLFRKPNPDVSQNPPYIYVRGSCDLALGQKIIGDELWKSGGTLPSDPENTILNKKVSFTMSDLIDEDNVTMRPPDRSDVLEVLHKKLGIQIIADHYSRWPNIMDVSDRTVAEVLSGLRDEMGYETYFGSDGKFLYVLSQCIGNLDEREVPNRLLRPWQEKFRKHGSFTLEELAQMASLPDKQLAAMRNVSMMLGLGELNNLHNPSEIWMLRLYSLLSGRQRREMTSDGTPVAAFNEKQRHALAKLETSNFDESAMDLLIPEVGAYRDGRRVDKPEPPEATAKSDKPAPVLVKLGKNYQDNQWDYQAAIDTAQGVMHSMGSVEAATKDEAMLKVLQQHPNANVENIEQQRNMIYGLTITYSDGTTKMFDMPVPVPESGR